MRYSSSYSLQFRWFCNGGNYFLEMHMLKRVGHTRLQQIITFISLQQRHHLAQAMCILNTEHCNIFESFSSEVYSEALDLLKINILATDLAVHIRVAEEQETMVGSKYDKSDPKQRKLFSRMLMTCCDLSDQTKHWRVSTKIAVSRY